MRLQSQLDALRAPPDEEASGEITYTSTATTRGIRVEATRRGPQRTALCVCHSGSDLSRIGRIAHCCSRHPLSTTFYSLLMSFDRKTVLQRLLHTCTKKSECANHELCIVQSSSHQTSTTRILDA